MWSRENGDAHPLLLTGQGLAWACGKTQGRTRLPKQPQFQGRWLSPGMVGGWCLEGGQALSCGGEGGRKECGFGCASGGFHQEASESSQALPKMQRQLPGPQH